MQQPWHAFESYGFHHELQPRLLDVNTGRHVSNIAILCMLAEARLQYRAQKMSAGLELDEGLMLRPAIVATDFVNMAFYPEPVIAGVALTASDADTFTLTTGLFQGRHCIAVQHCTIDAWHCGKDGRQVALPDSLRDRLRLSGAADAMPLAVSGNAPAPGDMPFHLRVSARYGDLDADGCFSEAALAEIADSARSTLVVAKFREAGHDFKSSRFATLAANMRSRFHAHRTVRGEIAVSGVITRVGNSSFDVRIAMFAGDVCLAVSDYVMVCTNRETDRPTRIPDAVRVLFESSQRHSPTLG